MQNAKQEALEAIQCLPDSVDTEEMMYRLYVLENIRRVSSMRQRQYRDYRGAAQRN